METGEQAETHPGTAVAHPEGTGPEHKPTLVEHIKEKLTAVKEKIIRHHDNHSSCQDHGAHNPDTGNEHEHAPSPWGGVESTPRGGVVSHPKYEDIPIPEGGLIMTAAVEEPENPEDHHGFKEKIKNVFSFPVPDTTVTPVKDFEETVPPNLKI